MYCKAEGTTKEKYVNYKGVKIYTEAYNYSPKAKEVVIFLHGLGGNHSHAEFLYNQSNPYTVISLDYLDHGKSGHLPSITFNNHLGSIKAVFDEYGIKKAHVVGHSFGADTAMMFAKKYPEKVNDVVLLDRAHFNFKDYEQFNITKNLIANLEYEPEAGLSCDEFSQYINILWNNDITKTWKTSIDVLLIGGNGKNFVGDSSTGTPSIAAVITMIKQNPSNFGIDPKIAETLPDITEKNASDLVNYLKTKISKFPNVNKKFSSIQTDFAHGDMVRDPKAKEAMRNYVIKYLSSDNK
jgi:pimeloyl-ACP methyl ester carboxylesterase